MSGVDEAHGNAHEGKKKDGQQLHDEFVALGMVWMVEINGV